MAGVEVSKLWAELAGSLFSNIDDNFLASFRAPGGANNRLGTWDAFDKTARYFKTLLFNATIDKPAPFFDAYRKAGNVTVGDPMFVTVHGCKINIDYYMAVDEYLFLMSAIDLLRVGHIVEIGAGFGRTAHTMLLLAAADRYTIVDIPEVLALSRAYLARVLPPSELQKLEFLEAQGSQWIGLRSDLVINIDSFQEMPVKTIRSYIDNVIAHSRYFYCKNPIAKYSPASIGLSVENTRTLDVFSLGLCQDVIDIFDDADLQRARRTYLEKYSPGLNWSVASERPLDIFPYMHHAVFENRDS